MDEKMIQMLEEYADDRLHSVAEEMIKDHMESDLIAKYTGISKEEVLAMKERFHPDTFTPEDVKFIKEDAKALGAQEMVYALVSERMLSEMDAARILGCSPEKVHKRMILSGYDMPKQ